MAASLAEVAIHARKLSAMAESIAQMADGCASPTSVESSNKLRDLIVAMDSTTNKLQVHRDGCRDALENSTRAGPSPALTHDASMIIEPTAVLLASEASLERMFSGVVNDVNGLDQVLSCEESDGNMTLDEEAQPNIDACLTTLFSEPAPDAAMSAPAQQGHLSFEDQIVLKEELRRALLAGSAPNAIRVGG